MIEGRKVVMDAVDERIAGVIPRRKGEELAGVEAHDGDLLLADISATS